jgi:hypothetical protein
VTAKRALLGIVIVLIVVAATWLVRGTSDRDDAGGLFPDGDIEVRVPEGQGERMQFFCTSVVGGGGPEPATALLMRIGGDSGHVDAGLLPFLDAGMRSAPAAVADEAEIIRRAIVRSATGPVRLVPPQPEVARAADAIDRWAVASCPE